MMRGFLAGGVTGVMISAVGLVLASLLAPQPAGNTPPAPPQTDVALADAPAGQAAPEAPAAAQDAIPVSEAEMTGIAAPEAAPEVETDPARAPQTGEPPAGLISPETAAPRPEVASEAPVLPSPQGAALTEPGGEADLSISTNPAQPLAPSGEESAFVLVLPDAENVVDTPEEPQGAPAAPPESAPLPDEQAATRLVVSNAPAQREEVVPVRRANDTTPPESAAPQAPALSRFAADFTPDGRPLFSIIMIDMAPEGQGALLLPSLELPISIALRGSDPDSASRAKAYRAAGFEVLMLSDQPTGATPADAATALEGGLNLLPQSIALLDAGTGGLGRDVGVIGTVMARLAEDGRGFVGLPGGLGATQREAEKAGIPMTTLYRDLDANDQNAATIRRFLDQAAFRARQQGQAVVLMRLRAESLSALEIWRAASRAQDVQFAPVSALLSVEN